MREHPARVRWHPVGDLPFPAGRDRAGADTVEQIVRRVGIPVVDGAETAAELAVELLQLAAEVEHALMVQYLYASVSLSSEPGPDGVVYREKVLRVAIQEMGHLATVQNLLLAVGGPEAMHLQCDVKRELSDKNPVPFVLEPVTAGFLAKAVAVEMPAEVPAELAAEVAELRALAEQSAGVELHRVGVLYELLQWMFQPPGAPARIDFAALAPLPDQPHVVDADLREPAELADYEALRQEWLAFEEDIILPTVHSCADARAALASIAEQGEGLPGAESSHFGEFLQIHRALRLGDVLVRPIARAPTLRPTGCAGEQIITHGYTRLWGEVFELQYKSLVLTIYHAMVTPRGGERDGLRADLAGLAVRAMRRVIGPVSDIVAALPLRPDDPAAAGPPYGLDRAVLADPDPDRLRTQHIRLLDRLAEVYHDIENRPEFPTHPTHPATLANLRGFDRQRRNLVSPNIPAIEEH